MDRKTRPLINWRTAALAGVLLAFTGHALATAEYDAWIASHAKKALGNYRGRDGGPIRLVVTEFTEPGPQERRAFLMDGEATEGIEMTEDGQIWGFSRDSFADRGGGGGSPLPAPVLAHLDELLTALPEDGGRLPPPRHRVLIQGKVGERLITRLYDRAQAPAAAWEVMRLGKAHAGLIVPEFKPQSEIDTHSDDIGGFLRLTPDGKQLLVTGSNGSLQFYDPVSHELDNELRGLGHHGIAFSPDGTRAVVPSSNEGSFIFNTKTWERTWQKFNSGQTYFTADGRHLVHDGRGGRFDWPLKVWDTTTWKSVEHLDDIPADSLCFRPAPKRPLAVVQSKAGVVSLWDTKAHRQIAVLRPAANVREVVFSPDESLVAVSTTRLDFGFETSYAIWRTENGALLHELHPFERGPREEAKGVVWTADGASLLVAVHADWQSLNTICLFNVRTGRHEAAFQGAQRINGLALLPGATQLVAGDDNGKIHFWDFQEALRKAREFQQSLPALP